MRGRVNSCIPIFSIPDVLLTAFLDEIGARWTDWKGN